MLHITETTENYEPSKELKEVFNNLCLIAAAAKVLDNNDLFLQAQNQYNSLSQQYNAVAKKHERGFWGQMWDNYTYRNRHVHKQGKLEDDSNFSTYKLWLVKQDKDFVLDVLKSALK